MKKLQEHDQRFDAMSDRFDAISEKFDVLSGRFDSISEKFDATSDRFDSISEELGRHDEQLDCIACAVLNHTERLEYIEKNMATKSDIRIITSTLDVLVGLAQKKDQELTFMGHRVEGIENDIRRIKPLVGLAS